MKFNPSMLVPAQLIEDASKPGQARSVEQLALANIAKMRAAFSNPEGAEGRLNFKEVGDRILFTLRVANHALVLGTYEENGTTADVREMAVPKENFLDALDFFTAKIKAGEFENQFSLLAEKREGRTTKLRATRQANKDAKLAKEKQQLTS